MLKPDWDRPPVQNPDPRITLEKDDARETEKALRSRGVVISDPPGLSPICREAAIDHSPGALALG